MRKAFATNLDVASGSYM